MIEFQGTVRMKSQKMKYVSNGKIKSSKSDRYYIPVPARFSGELERGMTVNVTIKKKE